MQKHNTTDVYVGYDDIQPVAYHVFCNSLIRNAKKPLNIHPLYTKNLESIYTETHTDMSNTFIYSRFLVPFLNGYEGYAIYADGDMIVNADISELLDLIDPNDAVSVVKHDYKTTLHTKYCGAPNEDYPRKNWSSVIVWNCGHPDNAILTPEFVASSTGKQLHRFTWIDDSDIGELPIEWNWLAGEYEAREDAKLIHYTLGTPCYEDFIKTSLADGWHTEYNDTKKPL